MLLILHLLAQFLRTFKFEGCRPARLPLGTHDHPAVGWWHFPSTFRANKANKLSTSHIRIAALPSEAIEPCEWKSWKELRQQVGFGGSWAAAVGFCLPEFAKSHSPPEANWQSAALQVYAFMQFLQSRQGDPELIGLAMLHHFPTRQRHEVLVPAAWTVLSPTVSSKFEAWILEKSSCDLGDTLGFHENSHFCIFFPPQTRSFGLSDQEDIAGLSQNAPKESSLISTRLGCVKTFGVASRFRGVFLKGPFFSAVRWKSRRGKCLAGLGLGTLMLVLWVWCSFSKETHELKGQKQ